MKINEQENVGNAAQQPANPGQKSSDNSKGTGNSNESEYIGQEDDDGARSDQNNDENGAGTQQVDEDSDTQLNQEEDADPEAADDARVDL